MANSMILRRSSFAHVLRLPAGRALAFHAVTQLRMAMDGELEALIAAFAAPRALPDEAEALARAFGHDAPTLAGAVAALYERGFLTDKTVDEEAAALAGELEQTLGRDPGEKLDRLRRERREGAADYWAAASTRKISISPRAGGAWTSLCSPIATCSARPSF